MTVEHQHNWDLTVPAIDFGSGFHQFDCACGATKILPYGVEPKEFTAPYDERGTIDNR